MRTWSIAGALDGLRKLEKLTRPPKLGFHDYDIEAGIPPGDEPPPVPDGRARACRAPGPFDCLGCSYYAACKFVEVPSVQLNESGGYTVKVKDGVPYQIGRDVFLSERFGLCPGCMLIGGLDPNCETCGGRGTVPQEVDERVVDNVRSVEVKIGDGSTWKGSEFSAYCVTGKGKCPTDCDRTQSGCVQTWGPDAEHLEASRRNYMAASDRAAALGPYEAPEQFAQLPHLVEDIRNLLHNLLHSLSPAAFTPGAGDTAPADGGAPPSPSAGDSNVDLIAEVLAAHRFRWANHSSIGSAAHCGCGYRPCDLVRWDDHVAPLIAERIEKATPPAPFTFGDLSLAARLVHSYALLPKLDPDNAASYTALADRLADAAMADPNQ